MNYVIWVIHLYPLICPPIYKKIYTTTRTSTRISGSLQPIMESANYGEKILHHENILSSFDLSDCHNRQKIDKIYLQFCSYFSLLPFNCFPKIIALFTVLQSYCDWWKLLYFIRLKITPTFKSRLALLIL